jgi:hypothetical protein
MTRHRWWTVLLVGCALGASACADRIVYIPIAKAPNALTLHSPDQVELLAVTPPSKPHIDIALLQLVHGPNDNGNDVAAMMATLRAQAGRYGCDALLITMVDVRYSMGSPTSIEGSCVVYTDRHSAASATALESPAPSLASPREAAPAPPPAHWAVAVAGTEPSVVHTAPATVAPVLTSLSPGQRILASPAEPGWSFVRLPNGRAGYIADAAIAVAR